MGPVTNHRDLQQVPQIAALVAGKGLCRAHDLFMLGMRGLERGLFWASVVYYGTKEIGR